MADALDDVVHASRFQPDHLAQLLHDLFPVEGGAAARRAVPAAAHASRTRAPRLPSAASARRRCRPDLPHVVGRRRGAVRRRGVDGVC